MEQAGAAVWEKTSLEPAVGCSVGFSLWEKPQEFSGSSFLTYEQWSGEVTDLDIL